MKINLAYGQTGLAVELPDEGATVIEPTVTIAVPFISTYMRSPVSPARNSGWPAATVANSVSKRNSSSYRRSSPRSTPTRG